MILIGSTSDIFASGKELMKTFTWNFKVTQGANIRMNNYDCNLTIHTWDRNEAEYHMTINAETRSDEDAEALNSYLQNFTMNNSASAVSFDSRFWENRNTIMGKTTMKLKNGKTINLVSIVIKAELYIPKNCRFSLGSKYSEIKMDDFAGQVDFDLYNDNLVCGSLESDAELNDKYSTIEFRDIKKLKANIYNSRLVAGNSGATELESKYSKVRFKVSGDVHINGYNDNFSFTSTGDVIYTAKYSVFESTQAGKAEFDCYEGSVTIGNLKDVRINSKYADFRFDKAENCTVNSAYNSRITVGKLKSLDISESKYSVYKAEELSGPLTDSDGYQDNLNISNMPKDFGRIKLDGKYMDISLGLPGSSSYRFKANITYPDLDINEESFRPIVKIQKSSQIEYDAVKGNEKENMPVIEVNGYQIKFRIRNI